MYIWIYILIYFCSVTWLDQQFIAQQKHAIPAVWNVAASASARNQSPELRFCSKLGWWNHVRNEKTLVD